MNEHTGPVTQRALAARQRDLVPAVGHADERFRKIFEFSNDAIFLVDPTGDEIVDVNPRACGMLGYEREELLHVPMSTIHPHEMPLLKAFARDVARHGRGWTDRLSCVTKGKRVLPAEMSASVLQIDGRPFLLAMVRDVTDRSRLQVPSDAVASVGVDPIVGSSPALLNVLYRLDRVAGTNASVLITGESGTGKELVARAIHARSQRRGAPLVRVNCASIPAELFESEFFGHVKGSFSGAVQTRQGRFELADGGTLFLDEVGELPLRLQGKLLRVLQDKEFERVGESRTRKVDVRIIAATNRNLLSEAHRKNFREDLYYRLNVFPIEVPPLRERPEDIAELARHCAATTAGRLGVQPPHLSAELIGALESYSWPGNVRELQNVIERAMIVARAGDPLHFDLPPMRRCSSDAPPPDSMTLADLAKLECGMIERALVASGGKIYGPGGAASRLGLPPTTLASRMKRLAISKP
jgi:PAS domain S-box-containing protein